MGKTNPTTREVIQHVHREEWAQYRRALRRENQAAFDRVVEAIEQRAMPIDAANPRDPRTLMLLSAIVALEREVADLRAQLDDTDDAADREGRGP